MSKIKIGAQVTAKVCPTKVTVSGTFQGYELQDKEDPTSVCGKVFYVKDGIQRLDFVYIDSIKVGSEGEDERIRKIMIEHFKNQPEQYSFGGLTNFEIVAWLEKRGWLPENIELNEGDSESIRKILYGIVYQWGNEQQAWCSDKKVIEKMLAYLEKQKEQKPVKLNDDTEVGLDRALQIVKAAKGNLYGYQSDDGIYECCHAIQTLERILKDGIEQQPVHTAKEMWKEMRLEVYAQASGNRHEPNYSDDYTKMFSLCDIDEIFEKIGNSTVGSQPAEWSEEDEEMLDAIIDIVSNSLYEPLCPREGMLAWLKRIEELNARKGE